MVSKATYGQRWGGKGENTLYDALVSSPSLREEEDDIICAPAEVRRCRFIAPAAAALGPMRLVGDRRDADTAAADMPPVVDERGRVDDAASLGSEEPPFREALCGVPEARFLHEA